jgi:hypothetical protein
VCSALDIYNNGEDAVTCRILSYFDHSSIDPTTMAAALLLSALLFSEHGVAFPGSPYDQTLLSDGKWDFDVSTFPFCCWQYLIGA